MASLRVSLVCSGNFALRLTSFILNSVSFHILTSANITFVFLVARSAFDKGGLYNFQLTINTFLYKNVRILECCTLLFAVFPLV
jgi:hypothetical protein